MAIVNHDIRSRAVGYDAPELCVLSLGHASDGGPLTLGDDIDRMSEDRLSLVRQLFVASARSGTRG